MGGNHMKKLFVAVALLSSAQAVQALDVWNATKVYANKAIFWKSESLTSLSFQSVFPKPIYEKSYFGLVLTGVTVVGAGAFTYFTAGAGAPVAAAGVSSVASWVAGGGAGSYMAGLSTIGGWFGGNAMLGSAILNGISIGVSGGGAAFATLPAAAKVGVMASVTASALDGVVLVQNPTTKNLSYLIRLTVPKELGGKGVRLLTNGLHEVEAKLLEADAGKDEKRYDELVEQKNALLREAVAIGEAALKKGGSNEDLIVLGILAKNAGHYNLFEELVNKIPVDKMENAGYIDYLKAVASIERRDIQTATNLLWKSWRLNPYAVEPPLLLINILGHEQFEIHEEEIRAIVERARKDFDNDKYGTRYSLVSLNYRLATVYLRNENYPQAQLYYDKAYDELSWWQTYFGDKSMKNQIRLGSANALYGQNKKIEAQKLFKKILADIKTDAEKSFVESQYAGNIET